MSIVKIASFGYEIFVMLSSTQSIYIVKMYLHTKTKVSNVNAFKSRSMDRTDRCNWIALPAAFPCGSNYSEVTISAEKTEQNVQGGNTDYLVN